MAARKTLNGAAEKPKIERRRLDAVSEEEDLVEPSYFAAGVDRDNLIFVSSGCALKDAALGGGYVCGRVANIIGDESTGKTLQAMEAAANFAMKYPKGWVRYAETEAAFDMPYAEALGMPLSRIEFNPGGRRIGTVEMLYEDMERCLNAHKKDPMGLYIVDSLDAISDEAEEKREFNEGSYGGTKPKALSKLFRMLVDRFEEQKVLVIIVSQTRDKIGVVFGPTKTRSGGKALNFYATHIEWLAELGSLKRTIDGVERTVGIKIRSKISKNKIALPRRTADYPVLYGYGIDDLTSSVEWLIDVGREPLLTPLGLSKAGYKVRVAALRNKGGPEVIELRAQLTKLVHQEWAKIETSFLPQSRKY